MTNLKSNGSNGMELSFKGDELVIRVKLDQAAIRAAPVSASGKSFLVASSRGPIPVGPPELGAKLILNLTLPREG
jgi:hypothetical protein